MMFVFGTCLPMICKLQHRFLITDMTLNQRPRSKMLKSEYDQEISHSHTVSHFSYAPSFQGPHFWIKMLESNILYAHLTFYLFDDIEKKSKSLMRIILQRQKKF